MGVGRPRIIESPQEFDGLAEMYFAERDLSNEPYLLTGLILALGLSSRASLDEYEKRPEFFNSVKKAKLRVEMEYEKRLGSTAPTGAIFALKNFGWKDQQNMEHSGKIQVDVFDPETRAKLMRAVAGND